MRSCVTLAPINTSAASREQNRPSHVSTSSNPFSIAYARMPNETGAPPASARGRATPTDTLVKCSGKLGDAPPHSFRVLLRPSTGKLE